MKTIKLFIILIIVTLSIQCKAQQPIINLEDDDGSEIVNAYYKDTNNLLNPFVGTWVLDDGTNYLKIVFEKKTMVYTGSYYEDLLIGEFQYKENDIEIINTLDKLNLPDTFPENRKHSIEGNYIRTSLSPFDDYTTDNFYIDLTMGEPNGFGSSLYVRATTINGQEAIQIFKYGGIKTVLPGETPLEPIIPNGFHYLIKQ